MNKWEYRFRGVNSMYPLNAELKHFGEQGWELVSVTQVGKELYYYFKRLKN